MAGKVKKKAKMGHTKAAPTEPKRKRVAVIVWKRTERGGLSGRMRFKWEDEL